MKIISIYNKEINNQTKITKDEIDSLIIDKIKELNK